MSAMGHRARRRLTWVSVAVVAGAVMGAALRFIASNSSPGTTSRAPGSQSQTIDQSVGVAYGDSAGQVLAKVGSPTMKQRTCWIYNANAHVVRGAYLGQFADGVRYCFGDGPAGGKAVSVIDVHVTPHTKLDGKWYPGGWNHAVTIMASPPASS